MSTDRHPSGYRVATETEREGPWLNRLSRCASPYLRQHASNPVDWWPWGDEALAEATRLDRPILVSVGYAACHWCHVMEHESFSDPAVAAWLNARFVAIKVDREERPEIDAWCMDALLALTGEGGWPLNLWLTPDLRPFYGGTYFPPYPRYGVPAFRDALRRVHESWTDGRAQAAAAGARLSAELDAAAAPRAGDPPLLDVVGIGIETLLKEYDWKTGGWGHGAKFPQAPRIELLLQHAALTGQPRARDAAAHLLDTLDRSGVHDHVGGGFHRYAVDEDWEVPHFEKMLYDNAQLARVFLRGFAVTGRQRFGTVAGLTLEYMLSELSAPGGGFWSSQDADDAGGEGGYYTWTPAELSAALGPLAPAIASAYAVFPGGNAEGGRSVMRRREETNLMGLARAKLRSARDRRPKPATDDKIVVAWNGLAVSALACAASLLGEARYAEAAGRAAEAVLAARRPDGALPRTLAPDAPPGVLDDYASLAEGLLDLHQATGAARWLVEAGQVIEAMLIRLADPATGALLHAEPGALGLRRVIWEEGAEPSGAGVALGVLVRAHALGLDVVSSQVLDRALGSASHTLGQHPAAAPSALRAVQLVWRHVNTVVIAGDDEGALALRRAAIRPWRPAVVVAAVGPEHGLGKRFGALAGKTPGKRSRAFLCEGNACLPPITDAATLSEKLDAARPDSGSR